MKAAQFLLALAAASSLFASEYHGTVKTHGLPLPGVSVIASKGEKKLATSTDNTGAFAFADLSDGVWTIELEMTGFETATRQVGIAPGAPAPEWELKMMQDAPATRGTSSRQQAALQASVPQEGGITSQEVTDLTQSAANSFLVQGSMSSALGLGPQNDWGPRGPGTGPDGLGGPGGPGGPGMMGMDGAGGVRQAGGPGGGPGGPPMGGGRGGPPPGGGPGGPPSGAMAMAGGGGPGGGAPAGGGPGGGGPGGPGGPGGFGGPPPGWMGRPNAMAFGNNRRSPANSYMASADFSLDNSAWDARTYSVTGAEVDKPSYAIARGGFMFGGPLVIPKVVSSTKRILFTLNLQFQHNRTGTVSDPVNMPTAAERSGQFSTAIYDPLTGTPFPNNQIPASRINATATALLQYYPYPNLAGTTRNYQTAWSGANNSHNLNSRISNVRLGGKDRLNFNLGYQGGDSITPNLFQFVDTGSNRAINAGLAWSHSFTSRVTNNLNYSFSRMRQLSMPYFAYRENVAADLGIAGTSQNPMNWGPPTLNFTNYASLNDGNASLNRNQTSGIGDSVIWVRGKQNLTFGGDYRRQQFNPYSDANGRGAYTFTGATTSQYMDGAAQSGTGNDLADFLLGLPASSAIRYGNPDKYFRGSGYDFYVNNDWRIASRFTLIAGLRWDYSSPVTELYGRLVNLSIAPGFGSVTTVVPGTISRDRNNISPRLGFAWRPLTRGSLVVRGGYGVYYNTSVYNQVASNMAQQPPFAQALSVTTSAEEPLTLQTGFLAATSQSNTSTFAIDPNYRIGYAQTWNITVQHDLPYSLFATAGYLGTKGTRLDQQFIPNSVPPGAAESALPHNYTYETSNGNSIYHAAQFQLNRRFHSGFMTRASYQFSKSIDDAGAGGRGQGNTPVAQNWLDLSAERALSSFDARHNFTMQLQYSTGMGTAGGTLLNGWKGALVKDWTVSTNISLHSGNPFTATAGGNRSQISGSAVANTVRADASGQSVSADGSLFNTAAFVLPAAGSWGSAGRNTIPGPTVFSLDGQLSRIFRFGERRSADLQFQAQNLLNHVTITSWGTVVGSTTYGMATAAAPMRKMTVGLRFRF
ncbi:MAG TPA: TonB-dependent receptor [Candidatus Acidoferrales bacterium]|nr:TonB-dependent receptor [Bryobacteraceae bacterium]HTS65282.1 TonB-dependent receptor [Candidatus Acidoferrales bacterium]